MVSTDALSQVVESIGLAVSQFQLLFITNHNLYHRAMLYRHNRTQLSHNKTVDLSM